MSDHDQTIVVVFIVSSVANVSNTTGYELEVFRGHLVRAMNCPTLIIPVLYSMGITTAALGKVNMLLMMSKLILISCNLIALYKVCLARHFLVT